jgi:hypothetical protein
MTRSRTGRRNRIEAISKAAKPIIRKHMLWVTASSGSGLRDNWHAIG